MKIFTVSGHYIYMDSAKMETGSVARVATPSFPASFGVCYLRFWFYMYGAYNTGPLRVGVGVLCNCVIFKPGFSDMCLVLTVTKTFYL